MFQELQGGKICISKSGIIRLIHPLNNQYIRLIQKIYSNKRSFQYNHLQGADLAF